MKCNTDVPGRDPVRAAMRPSRHSDFQIGAGGAVRWFPTPHATALGIGQADYGIADVALMGVSAARAHGAIPRAIAVAAVAVPKKRPALTSDGARLVFVRRDVSRLDVERTTTELGDGWVTMIEQTLLDLAARPELGDLARADVEEAIRALAARTGRGCGHWLSNNTAQQRWRLSRQSPRTKIVLDPQELSRTASAFGVTEDQVRRDHLISHILAALASLGLPVVFFGGTALARTWLTDPANGGRLSEDIDLYSAQCQDVAQPLTRQLPIMLRREFPWRA